MTLEKETAQTLAQDEGGLSYGSMMDPRYHGYAHRSEGGSWHYRVIKCDFAHIVAGGWIKGPKGAMRNLLHKTVEEFAHRSKRKGGAK